MEGNFYTKNEEIVNAITHGIGTGLAIAALVILVVSAVFKGTPWHVVSFAIFGAMLVILYLDSTLYHSLTNKNVKKLFRKFDHMSIYLLIAGTYTPYCFTALRGPLGWTMFGVAWGCTIVGIVLNALFLKKKSILSTILYFAMGCFILVAAKPLYMAMTFKGFLFLLIGGAFYTVGAFFYVKDKIFFNHGIWHLFVIGGSIFHFFSVLSLLNIK